MRLVVLRNSISGRAAGRRAVDELVLRLGSAGHETNVREVNRSMPRDEELVIALRSAVALIVAGGDGTVHHVAPLAMEAGVPLVQFPLGTENLFSREFGISSIPCILSALERMKPRKVDVGVCAARPFLLMASVGFDSCVVERVAAARRGGISHATYARHCASEFVRPRFVSLSIRVDGRVLVAERAGMVVIANSRQYAGRLNPARGASMTDGVLDVLFLPIDSRVGLVRRALQVMRGTHLGHYGVPYALGTDIVIVPKSPVPLQLDGEHAGVLPAAEELHIGIRPLAMSVLT